MALVGVTKPGSVIKIKTKKAELILITLILFCLNFNGTIDIERFNPF